MSDDRLARLLALKAAAEAIADPHTPAGIRAREELSESTLLSPEGVDFALTHCLEHQVSRSVLSALIRKCRRVPGASVLLSANVFSAAFRAIALALCQSTRVTVRPSTRDPVMTRLLHKGSGGAFELSAALSPQPREHIWVYGTEATIRSVKSGLPPGVKLHAHGPGLGAAVLVESEDSRQDGLPPAVDALAMDTVAFDQRGCLSPRIVLLQGSRHFAEMVCDHLVASLKAWEGKVPRGRLSDDEQADATRFVSTMHFVGSSVSCGKGLVSLDPVKDRIFIPPIGRHLHVTVTDDAIGLLTAIGERLTTVGSHNAELLPGRLLEAIGPRRYVELGQMQRPAFDGPVDLRSGFEVS